jgi:hypothetical protein
MAKARQRADERAGGSPQLTPDAPASHTNSPQDGHGRLDLIARRAYERFQMRGGEHGRDQEDWFEAERELNADRQQ